MYMQVTNKPNNTIRINYIQYTHVYIYICVQLHTHVYVYIVDPGSIIWFIGLAAILAYRLQNKDFIRPTYRRYDGTITFFIIINML